MEHSHWGTQESLIKRLLRRGQCEEPQERALRAANNAGSASSPHHLEATEGSSTEPGQWGEDH